MKVEGYSDEYSVRVTCHSSSLSDALTSPRLALVGNVGIRRRLVGDLGGKSLMGSCDTGGLSMPIGPVSAGRINSLRLLIRRSCWENAQT